MHSKQLIPKKQLWGISRLKLLLQWRQACRRQGKALRTRSQTVMHDRTHAWALSDACVQLILDQLININRIKYTAGMATVGSAMHHALLPGLRAAMRVFMAVMDMLQDHLLNNKALDVRRVRCLIQQAGL